MDSVADAVVHASQGTPSCVLSLLQRHRHAVGLTEWQVKEVTASLLQYGARVAADEGRGTGMPPSGAISEAALAILCVGTCKFERTPQPRTPCVHSAVPCVVEVGAVHHGAADAASSDSRGARAPAGGQQSHDGCDAHNASLRGPSGERSPPPSGQPPPLRGGLPHAGSSPSVHEIPAARRSPRRGGARREPAAPADASTRGPGCWSFFDDAAEDATSEADAYTRDLTELSQKLCSRVIAVCIEQVIAGLEAKEVPERLDAIRFDASAATVGALVVLCDVVVHSLGRGVKLVFGQEPPPPLARRALRMSALLIGSAAHNTATRAGRHDPVYAAAVVSRVSATWEVMREVGQACARVVARSRPEEARTPLSPPTPAATAQGASTGRAEAAALAVAAAAAAPAAATKPTGAQATADGPHVVDASVRSGAPGPVPASDRSDGDDADADPGDAHRSRRRRRRHHRRSLLPLEMIAIAMTELDCGQGLGSLGHVLNLSAALHRCALVRSSVHLLGTWARRWLRNAKSNDERKHRCDRVVTFVHALEAAVAPHVDPVHRSNVTLVRLITLASACVTQPASLAATAALFYQPTAARTALRAISHRLNSLDEEPFAGSGVEVTMLDASLASLALLTAVLALAPKDSVAASSLPQSTGHAPAAAAAVPRASPATPSVQAVADQLMEMAVGAATGGPAGGRPGDAASAPNAGADAACASNGSQQRPLTVVEEEEEEEGEEGGVCAPAGDHGVGAATVGLGAGRAMEAGKEEASQRRRGASECDDLCSDEAATGGQPLKRQRRPCGLSDGHGHEQGWQGPLQAPSSLAQGSDPVQRLNSAPGAARAAGAQAPPRLRPGTAPLMVSAPASSVRPSQRMGPTARQQQWGAAAAAATAAATAVPAPNAASTQSADAARSQEAGGGGRTGRAGILSREDILAAANPIRHKNAKVVHALTLLDELFARGFYVLPRPHLVYAGVTVGLATVVRELPLGAVLSVLREVGHLVLAACGICPVHEGEEDWSGSSNKDTRRVITCGNSAADRLCSLSCFTCSGVDPTGPDTAPAMDARDMACVRGVGAMQRATVLALHRINRSLFKVVRMRARSVARDVTLAAREYTLPFPRLRSTSAPAVSALRVVALLSALATRFPPMRPLFAGVLNAAGIEQTARDVVQSLDAVVSLTTMLPQSVYSAVTSGTPVADITLRTHVEEFVASGNSFRPSQTWARSLLCAPGVQCLLVGLDVVLRLQLSGLLPVPVDHGTPALRHGLASLARADPFGALARMHGTDLWVGCVPLCKVRDALPFVSGLPDLSGCPRVRVISTLLFMPDALRSDEALGLGRRVADALLAASSTLSSLTAAELSLLDVGAHFDFAPCANVHEPFLAVLDGRARRAWRALAHYRLRESQVLATETGPQPDHPFAIKVRRDHLLEDAFTQLEASFPPKSLELHRRRLTVHFANELGDGDGVAREFFALAAQQLAAALPEITTSGSDRGARRQWDLLPEGMRQDPVAVYRFVGRIIGLAAAARAPLGISLRPLLVACLLGRRPTLEDLHAEDPLLARSYSQVVTSAADRIQAIGAAARWSSASASSRAGGSRKRQRDSSSLARANSKISPLPAAILTFGSPSKASGSGGAGAGSTGAAIQGGSGEEEEEDAPWSLLEWGCEAEATPPGAPSCLLAAPHCPGLSRDTVKGSNVTSDAVGLNLALRIASRFRLDFAPGAFPALMQGLGDAIPLRILQTMTTSECVQALSGSLQLPVQAWRMCTQYTDGFTARSPQVLWFWEAVSDLEFGERQSLLQFATGTPSAPALWLQEAARANGAEGWHAGEEDAASGEGEGEAGNPALREEGEAHDRRLMRLLQGGARPFLISRAPNGSDDHLPMARTCFSQLILPAYSSKEVLTSRLRRLVQRVRAEQPQQAALPASGDAPGLAATGPTPGDEVGSIVHGFGFV